MSKPWRPTIESSTKQKQVILPPSAEFVWLVDEYEQLMATFPVDLEETARETQALVRCREVKRAVDLLRMVFAYAVCVWSLRIVGAWCLLIGIAFFLTQLYQMDSLLFVMI